jgi:hypothetical protein
MGRGLSGLQRQILAMAESNRRRQKVESCWEIYVVSRLGSDDTVKEYVKAARALVKAIRDPTPTTLEVSEAQDANGNDYFRVPYLWVQLALEDSKIQDAWAMLKLLMRCAQEEVGEALAKAGRAVQEGDVRVGDDYTHAWARYGRYGTEAEAAAAVEELKAKGVGGGMIEWFHTAPGNVPQLWFADVLADCFGLRPHLLRQRPGERRTDYGQCFDREAVGRARYDAASASASRALSRLVARDFLYATQTRRHEIWTSRGYFITAAGTKEGGRILDEGPDILPEAYRQP